jgi:hypothetical protein
MRAKIKFIGRNAEGRKRKLRIAMANASKLAHADSSKLKRFFKT